MYQGATRASEVFLHVLIVSQVRFHTDLRGSFSSLDMASALDLQSS